MDGLRRPHVRRIVLADFRSYARLDLALPRANVALSGLNGAGKTNLLEALSFLTPGRGLRRADLAECVREGGGGGWAVSVEIDDEPGGLVLPVQLGTGLEPGDAARKCRVDRVPTASARSFADHVRIVWLTPAMDGLFTGPASERRRFLDRIVLTVDSDHAARVTGLDRALRNRNRVLEEGRQSGRLDQAWAEATEREVAALGTAVAAARHETVARLAALIESGRDDGSPFPWAEIALRGTVEDFLVDGPALEAEDRFRTLLRQNRARDAAAGRTLAGPHLPDLAVRHGPKRTDAGRASTGEQKALLVGLVLAQARLVDAMSGLAPLILLDELAAHFDPLRRAALFEILQALGGQVFMTGADPQVFEGAAGVGRFGVEAGVVRVVG